MHPSHAALIPACIGLACSYLAEHAVARPTPWACIPRQFQNSRYAHGSWQSKVSLSQPNKGHMVEDTGRAPLSPPTNCCTNQGQTLQPSGQHVQHPAGSSITPKHSGRPPCLHSLYYALQTSMHLGCKARWPGLHLRTHPMARLHQPFPTTLQLLFDTPACAAWARSHLQLVVQLLHIQVLAHG